MKSKVKNTWQTLCVPCGKSKQTEKYAKNFAKHTKIKKHYLCIQ
jgi:hypothetical protein